MSDNVLINSFATGELAPSLYARTDLAAYHSGLAICRNFFVDYRSGVSTRSGTKFIIQCKASNTPVRLIPFSVSTTITYVIEFGDHYCRFYNNGAVVLEAAFPITLTNNAAPLIVRVPGNNFIIGDWIFTNNVVGVPGINGRYFIVQAISGNDLTLTDVNGNLVDSTTWGTYLSGGTASRVYTIISPYAASDLQLLKFVQSVSQLYLAHPSYPPTSLSFNSPTNWTFTSLSFATTLATPANVVLSVNIPNPGQQTPVSNTTYAYCVTSVDQSGQESLPGFSNQFTTAFTTGSGDISIVQGTATLTWNAVPGAIGFNIYKAQVNNGPAGGTIPTGVGFGFAGSTTSLVNPSFIDSNIIPDFTIQPPQTNNNPFANGNNPSCVTFFQQRSYWASSASAPATFWASQPGAFLNMNESNPVQASDFIQGTIVSTQLNQIKHMLPMPGGLIMLTGRSAFTLSSGQGANATLAVTPLNATITPQAYNGSSDVAPIVVNEDIMYIQAKGSIIRDLAYNIYAAIYTGTDVSIKSNHLFFNHLINYWAYAEEPFKIIWSIRDDGVLLSFTYIKEQQIVGWARHDTQGSYKAVTTVQEGTVDATYFIVQRQIGGTGVYMQWVERQMERTFTYGAEDAFCVDAGVGSTLFTPTNLGLGVFLGNNSNVNGSACTIQISGPGASPFSTTPGQIIRVVGGIIRVTSYASPTQVSGVIIQPLILPPGASAQSYNPGVWNIATPATKFFGFSHLIGFSINVLADGSVYNGLSVASDGSITLPNAATKVTGGLGFQAQMQTMPLDLGEPTVQGKRKKIGALNLKLANSRGLKVGRTFNTLVQMKDQFTNIPPGTQIPLISGDARVIVDALWDVPGQICIQIDDPLPASVLGVIPEYIIGDTPK